MNVSQLLIPKKMFQMLDMKRGSLLPWESVRKGNLKTIFCRQDTSYNHLLVPIPSSTFSGPEVPSSAPGQQQPGTASSNQAVPTGDEVTASEALRRQKHASGDNSAMQFSSSPNLGNLLVNRHFDTKNIARSHWSSWTGRYCELHTKISSCYNESRSCLNAIF